MMIKQIRTAIAALIVFSLLTGVLYPFVVTLIGQVVFSHQANGSLIVQNGKVIGSNLIGQAFNDPNYFWSRPSATTPPYNGASSSGSNLGPLNADLIRSVTERIETLRKADPAGTEPIPVDLVAASGSGLDPHISPAAAYFQIGRVATTRNLDKKAVQSLVDHFTEGRQLGILGEPRVNVLKLNLALDQLKK